MAEPKIVVEHREHLWYLLTEATQLEHMIMCQYLYAAFSLKRDPAEGLTAEQAAATGRWRQVLRDIAIEEMLHLALVVQPDVGHRRGADVRPGPTSRSARPTSRPACSSTCCRSARPR